MAECFVPRLNLLKALNQKVCDTVVLGLTLTQLMFTC